MTTKHTCSRDRYVAPMGVYLAEASSDALRELLKTPDQFINFNNPKWCVCGIIEDEPMFGFYVTTASHGWEKDWSKHPYWWGLDAEIRFGKERVLRAIKGRARRLLRERGEPWTLDWEDT